MLDDHFWAIIQASRETSVDCESQSHGLRRILSELSSSAILEFDELFRQKVNEAYRWDLWGIAYLINGGCSDDSFEYFRYWLVGRGRDVYQNVLNNPQAILEYLSDDDEIECESLLYAISSAYEDLAGEEMPIVPMEQPGEPAGEMWNEEELEDLFPLVAEKYW